MERVRRKNNKGSIPGIFITFGIVILIVSLLYFQANPNSSSFENPVLDLKWTDVGTDVSESNTLLIIIYNFVNFLGDSIMRISVEVSNWAYYNQDVANPHMLIILLVLFLLSPVLVALFKIIIIIFILVKEYNQSKKEKKELQKYGK